MARYVERDSSRCFQSIDSFTQTRDPLFPSSFPHRQKWDQLINRFTDAACAKASVRFLSHEFLPRVVANGVRARQCGKPQSCLRRCLTTRVCVFRRKHPDNERYFRETLRPLDLGATEYARELSAN